MELDPNDVELTATQISSRSKASQKAWSFLLCTQSNMDSVFGRINIEHVVALVLHLNILIFEQSSQHELPAISAMIFVSQSTFTTERVMKQQGKRNPPKPEQELKRALEYKKGPSHTAKFLHVRRSEKTSSACELAAWFSCHLQAAPLEDLLFSMHHSA